jgi:hypothetical protein
MKKIPEQWLVAKTIPFLKSRGLSKDLENYRQITILCFISKIFNKQILRCTLKIQEMDRADLCGDYQHGFKKNRSASKLSIKLFSEIARAFREENYVLVASLDLSSALGLDSLE